MFLLDSSILADYLLKVNLSLMGDFLRKNKILILRILILIILVWISIGFFPVLNIEGDGALFSAGCERLYANGFRLPPDYFYQWDMQPLVGILVVAVKFILPVLSCEIIYNILTILFSLTYLFIAALFISRIIKIRWEYCFFIILLFPESYSISYYSNTTIFASVFVLLGFLFILKKPLNYYSIVFLIFAPLFRVDVLAIYPVIFFIFLKDFNLKNSVLFTAFYALSVIIFISLVFFLLKANPINTLKHYQLLVDVNEPSFNFESFFKINATFYTIGLIILIVIGFIYLLVSRNYKLLFVILLPIVTFYYLYNDFTGIATKHLQYIIPFIGLSVAAALLRFQELTLQRKRIFAVFIFVVFLVQSFIGVRFYPNSKPWISKEYAQLFPQPTCMELYSHQTKGGKLMFVIGAGQIIPTADELMLLSGNFFAPFFWHNIKKNELKDRNIIAKLCSGEKDSLYFMTTQSSDWIMSQELHGLGFKINDIKVKKNSNKITSEYCFEKGRKRVLVTRIDVDRKNDSFNNAIRYIPHRPLYVYARWDWQLYLINEKKTLARPISSSLSIIP